MSDNGDSTMKDGDLPQENGLYLNHNIHIYTHTSCFDVSKAGFGTPSFGVVYIAKRMIYR